jgi:hypothetical protein
VHSILACLCSKEKLQRNTWTVHVPPCFCARAFLERLKGFPAIKGCLALPSSSFTSCSTQVLCQHQTAFGPCHTHMPSLLHHISSLLPCQCHLVTSQPVRYMVGFILPSWFSRITVASLGLLRLHNFVTLGPTAHSVSHDGHALRRSGRLP